MAEAPPDSVCGRWDATRLNQVFTNLIANAIKHTVRGEIRVAVSATQSEAVVTVIDEGPGIVPSELGHLFQPFSRLRSARGQTGHGLGLFMAKSIVEAHGGHIWAAPGEDACGTAFCFTVPLLQ